MKRDYTRIRNGIKATNKKTVIKEWLPTYREVLYDMMKMKTDIYDLKDNLNLLINACSNLEDANIRNHKISDKRLNKIEKKLGIV